MEESLNACAFIILAILALHPYSDVDIQQGESTIF